MKNKRVLKLSEEELNIQNMYVEKIREKNEALFLNSNKIKKYITITYGCQMNVHDSENIDGMLEKMGFLQADNREEADIILFNTCCVRENAENKVYGNVGALQQMKQNNPNLIIGVCGCMMQQNEVSEDLVNKFPFLDLVFGTHNLYRLPELLYNAINSNHTVIEIMDDSGSIIEDLPIKRAEGVSAWVSITYGCDNFCSYCIVPYVRGRERSRSRDNILEEIKLLADQGYKEITLLGQNVNSYGKDLEENYYFHNLLNEVNQINGIDRIRFMTSHPKDLSDDLIYEMSVSNNICEHIHLPIQSGSNNVLKAMNRKYSRENYFELIDKLRTKIPEIAITTDIIVGFPGETENDFKETLDLMEKVEFDSAYTFIYSPRTGTPAAEMINQIDINIKKERLQSLMNLQNRITKKLNEKLLNKTLEILVEGPSKNNEKILSGRTRDNKIVNFAADKSYIGKIVHVNIINTKTWTLEGELL